MAAQSLSTEHVFHLGGFSSPNTLAPKQNPDETAINMNINIRFIKKL
jgi:hypothetical protein